MMKFALGSRPAPAVIVACGDPKESGSKNGMDCYLVDVAISLEQLVLAAAALGLGTCWMGGFDEEKLRRILGIPKGIRVVAVTPMGYPEDKPRLGDRIVKAVAGSRKRKLLEEIFHREKW